MLTAIKVSSRRDIPDRDVWPTTIFLFPVSVRAHKISLTGISHFRVRPGLSIKTRLSAQPLIRKWFFILMQIKLIFARKVVYLASFWKRGFWNSEIFLRLLVETRPLNIYVKYPSEPRKGPAVCRAKEAPSFFSYFKTLSIGPVPGIEPATSLSAVERSTDWANPAVIKWHAP